MKRAVIIQGLGFGDEGKGATVDFLTRHLNADLVVRYCGGSQAAHNVQLPSGVRHTFSQFGAGTLAGARTYLSQRLILHMGALIAEAKHLETLGVAAPLERLFIHPRALVTTEYTQAMNRLRELARGAARHGSCGYGVGETRHYWLRYGADTITAGDLAHFDTLADKLELQRQRLLLELQDVPCTSDAARRLTAQAFGQPSYEVAEELHRLGRHLQLSATVPHYQTAIFEGAQGVLLDEWRGFHPYTTWSTVTQHHALELVAQSGAEWLCSLGLTRAYATRHGAGPFPTEDSRLKMTDQGNPWNAWQHGMRFGRLDLVLLDYALAVSGVIDGLVVNCLDEVEDPTPVCLAYEELERLAPAEFPNLQHQTALTQQLLEAKPIYRSFTPTELLTHLAERAPLAITSYGRTWRDRRLIALPFRRLHVPAVSAPGERKHTKAEAEGLRTAP